MIWKGLMVVTGSESPIVVVLSGSMEPAFHRGDLLFLTNDNTKPIRAGMILLHQQVFLKGWIQKQNKMEITRSFYLPQY